MVLFHSFKSPYETEAGVHIKGGDGAVSHCRLSIMKVFFEGFFIMLK